MHLNYKSIAQNKKIFEQLTGMNRSRFESLVHNIDQIWSDDNKRGKRAHINTIQDKLFLYIIHLRAQLTNKFIRHLFGFRSSDVSKIKQAYEMMTKDLDLMVKPGEISSEDVLKLIYQSLEQRN